MQFFDAKPPRKCYACGNVGHMARNCLIGIAESKSQPSLSTSNAVALAGKEDAKVFSAVVIEQMRIADALIDIGSAFLILRSAVYSRLPNEPLIQSFTRAAPYVVKVRYASAEIVVHVDTPVKLQAWQLTICCRCI